MKTSLLCAFALMAALVGRAQVIVNVLAPTNLTGSYTFTWAAPGTWGTPDLNLPVNSVTDTLAFVDDGTASDSLGCNTLVNGAAVSGKIAVVYRGTCEFGHKALMAQDQGAVAVVIINNVPGAPVVMGAGADGANVTIPVVMIGQSDGLLMRDSIAAGNVVMFIGSLLNVYANNLGMDNADVLMAKHSGDPMLTSTDSTEFSVPLGAFIHNNGSNDQAAVSLHAEIMHNGASVYSHNSVALPIVSDDSLFIPLPDFKAASYSGYYQLTYSIQYQTTDQYPNDNIFKANFLVDSLISNAAVDSASHMPINGVFYRPATSTGAFSTCIHFQDPHASRLRADGIWTSALAAAGDTTLADDNVEVHAYTWDDDFTGLSDAPTGTFNVSEVAYAIYYYTQNLQGDLIYIPFDQPVTLVDNQRYLFCATTTASTVYLGYDAVFDYTQNIANNDQPVSIVQDGANWYAAGFGPGTISGVGVKTSPSSVGINESHMADITPYPNPAAHIIHVPLSGHSGTGLLRIIDLAGNTVTERQVDMSGTKELTVDVSGITDGVYTFNINFKDGNSSSFRVAISK